MANFVRWGNLNLINLDNVNEISFSECSIEFTFSAGDRTDWNFDSESECLEAINYILTGEVKGKKEKSVKSKSSYPANTQEEFERLWAAKGRKGSKQKALNSFKSKYCLGENSKDVKAFVDMLISNIERRNLTEMGAPEQHLTSYLNGRYWES